MSLKGLSILPSVFTSANLLCGYISILFTAREEYVAACWMIILSWVCDVLDGRIARLTSVTSKFGAELDSLADLVAFGVAPGMLVYYRYMGERPVLGAAISFVFVLCGALRLARFNITPPSDKDVFEGLPIPAGAAILCSLTLYEMQFFNEFLKMPDAAVPFVVLITAFLMVSKVPYPSMKKSKKTGRQRFILAAGFLVCLVIAPPIALFLISWGYACYGLFVAILQMFMSLWRRVRPPRTIDAVPPAPPTA